MVSYGPTDVIDQDFLERLEIIFGSPASFNGSFLTPSLSSCSLDNSGIDLKRWKEVAEKLKTCRHDTINDLLHNGITK